MADTAGQQLLLMADTAGQKLLVMADTAGQQHSECGRRRSLPLPPSSDSEEWMEFWRNWTEATGLTLTWQLHNQQQRSINLESVAFFNPSLFSLFLKAEFLVE